MPDQYYDRLGPAGVAELILGDESRKGEGKYVPPVDPSSKNFPRASCFDIIRHGPDIVKHCVVEPPSHNLDLDQASSLDEYLNSFRIPVYAKQWADVSESLNYEDPDNALSLLASDLQGTDNVIQERPDKYTPRDLSIPKQKQRPSRSIPNLTPAQTFKKSRKRSETMIASKKSEIVWTVRIWAFNNLEDWSQGSAKLWFGFPTCWPGPSMNEHDLHTFVYMMLQYDPRRKGSKDWALFSFEARPRKLDWKSTREVTDGSYVILTRDGSGYYHVVLDDRCLIDRVDDEDQRDGSKFVAPEKVRNRCITRCRGNLILCGTRRVVSVLAEKALSRAQVLSVKSGEADMVDKSLRCRVTLAQYLQQSTRKPVGAHIIPRSTGAIVGWLRYAFDPNAYFKQSILEGYDITKPADDRRPSLAKDKWQSNAVTALRDHPANIFAMNSLDETLFDSFCFTISPFDFRKWIFTHRFADQDSFLQQREDASPIINLHPRAYLNSDGNPYPAVYPSRLSLLVHFRSVLRYWCAWGEMNGDDQPTKGGILHEQKAAWNACGLGPESGKGNSFDAHPTGDWRSTGGGSGEGGGGTGGGRAEGHDENSGVGADRSAAHGGSTVVDSTNIGSPDFGHDAECLRTRRNMKNQSSATFRSTVTKHYSHDMFDHHSQPSSDSANTDDRIDPYQSIDNMHRAWEADVEAVRERYRQKDFDGSLSMQAWSADNPLSPSSFNQAIDNEQYLFNGRHREEVLEDVRRWRDFDCRREFQSVRRVPAPQASLYGIVTDTCLHLG